MSWLAQVRHVLRKDVREHRVMIMLYLCLVLLSAITVLSMALRGDAGADLTNLFNFGVGVFGVVLLAASVQSDSPTRSDAFWATRPFHASAMLAAKVAFGGLIIIGIPLVGQFVSLLILDLPLSETLTSLVRSALIVSILLLVAMALAANTRDLRSVFVALVAFLIMAVVLAASSRSWTVSTTLRTSLLIAGVVGILSLLAILYRSRSMRWRERFAGVVSLATVTVASFGGSPPVERVVGDPVGPSLLALERTPSTLVSPRSDLHLSLRITAPHPGRRYAIAQAATELTLLDGSTMHVPLQGNVTVRDVLPPVVSRARWIGQQDRPQSRVQFQVPLDRHQRVAVARGLRRVVLTGRLTIIDEVVAATVPISTIPHTVRPGWRLRLSDYDVELGTASLTARSFVVAIGRNQESPTNRYGFDVPFALLNPQRNEVMSLRNQGGRGGGAWIVLPGVPIQTRIQTLESGSEYFTDTTGVPDSWFSAARLVVFDIVQRGSHPVRAELHFP
jgi:hypothetical protein